MKRAQDIMTKNVKSCWPDDNLAKSASLMWEHDCGVMPVVTGNGKIVGILTDRDICMAVTMQNRTPAEITVKEIMSTNVKTCSINDNVIDALKIMQNNKVRRLPVVSDDGKLQGILSLNDIILQAVEGKGKGAVDIPYENIVNTFRSICEHRATKAATA
jgi:CBS domain-containing protein